MKMVKTKIEYERRDLKRMKDELEITKRERWRRKWKDLAAAKSEAAQLVVAAKRKFQKELN